MKHTGTKDTMPMHQWVSSVIEAAGVSVDDAERLVTRERLHLWFRTGEPVWMAADSARHMVSIGKRHERAEREVNYLYDKMKVSQ
jgi:hypothetical protein